MKEEREMKNILPIIKELQDEPSKNGKIAILNREYENEELKTFLVYLLDTSLVYGLQEKKIRKFLGQSTNQISFQNITEAYSYLLKNNTGTDDDAKLVATFINEVSQGDKELQDIYLKAITKKLRLGLNVATVSKVWTHLIERFELMKGNSYHINKKGLEGKPFSLSEKMNGIRCTTIKRGSIIINKTRQNKEILELNDINEDMRELPDGVYDGELVVKNSERFRLREVLQETMKIVNSDLEDKVVDYWIFDYLTEEEFQDGKSKTNYFERRDRNPVEGTDFENVRIIPELYRGTDESVIEGILDEYVDIKGREGLFYYKDLPYVAKRTSNILKIKKKYTSDLLVTGFEEGKGKYKSMLGALVLDYKGFVLNCSGMSDEQRKDIWNNKEKYLGKIVEIEHEQETTNEKGGLSLEYPVFLQWRFDKDEVNYAHE